MHIKLVMTDIMASLEFTCVTVIWVFSATFNDISNYMVVVIFIWWGKQEKNFNLRKSGRNLITYSRVIDTFPLTNLNTKVIYTNVYT